MPSVFAGLDTNSKPRTVEVLWPYLPPQQHLPLAFFFAGAFFFAAFLAMTGLPLKKFQDHTSCG